MASVYEAFAPGHGGLETPVALKLIRRELAQDERYAAMFFDEASLVAQLSHDNLVRTLDHGIWDGQPFIAMELLAGRTLADVWDLLAARGESLPIMLAAWICARVADGLHAAHEAVDRAGRGLGIIHRDVNPSNIFLTFSGDVKLIDFGLAKSERRRTQSSGDIVKGKLPYLAPEQIRRVPLDRRVDVFALGTTLWELATMQRLFRRETDALTLRAVYETRVPDPRTLAPAVPATLWQIMQGALHPDRERRYASADHVARALDWFVGSDGPEMKPQLAALLAQTFPAHMLCEPASESDGESETIPMRFVDMVLGITPNEATSSSGNRSFATASGVDTVNTNGTNDTNGGYRAPASPGVGSPRASVAVDVPEGVEFSSAGQSSGSRTSLASGSAFLGVMGAGATRAGLRSIETAPPRSFAHTAPSDLPAGRSLSKPLGPVHAPPPTMEPLQPSAFADLGTPRLLARPEAASGAQRAKVVAVGLAVALGLAISIALATR